MTQLLKGLVWKGPFDATFSVDPLSIFLDGHFPGAPILPGALILEVSRGFLEGCGQDSSTLKNRTSGEFRIENAKFAGAVTPRTLFRLLGTSVEEGKWDVQWIEAESGKEIVSLRVCWGSGHNAA